MPSRNPKRPSRMLLLSALLTLARGLAGCQSDDAAAPERASSGTSDLRRCAGDTSDSGSRFMNAGGPVGGLTVETPPVAPPRRGRPYRGRPVTQR